MERRLSFVHMVKFDGVAAVPLRTHAVGSQSRFFLSVAVRQPSGLAETSGPSWCLLKIAPLGHDPFRLSR